MTFLTFVVYVRNHVYVDDDHSDGYNDKNVLVDATSVSDNWPLTVNVDPAELPP